MKTVREINEARRNNPEQMAVDDAHSHLSVVTSILDNSMEWEEGGLGAQIREWFAARDRFYNARVALARKEGTLSEVPARSAAPVSWPPVEGDIWMTRHGWAWELRGGVMVAWGGPTCSVEEFRGEEPVLMSRLWERPLLEAMGL